MNAVRSLEASAEVFARIGQVQSAEMCRDMIRDCVSMNEIFGEGAGDALHGQWASQLAARAAEQLILFNRRQAA